MFILIKTSLIQVLADSTLPTRPRTYGMTSVKEVADWCHTFMRLVAASGWRREEGVFASVDIQSDRLTQIFLDLKRYGLEPLTALGSKRTQDKIMIKIEPIEPVTAYEASKLFSI